MRECTPSGLSLIPKICSGGRAARPGHRAARHEDGRVQGDKVLEQLLTRWPNLCVIVVTGYPSLEDMRATFKMRSSTIWRSRSLSTAPPDAAKRDRRVRARPDTAGPAARAVGASDQTAAVERDWSLKDLATHETERVTDQLDRARRQSSQYGKSARNLPRLRQEAVRNTRVHRVLIMIQARRDLRNKGRRQEHCPLDAHHGGSRVSLRPRCSGTCGSTEDLERWMNFGSKPKGAVARGVPESDIGQHADVRMTSGSLIWRSQRCYQVGSHEGAAVLRTALEPGTFLSHH